MSGDDSTRLWWQTNTNLAGSRRALEAIQNIGRALPCRVTAISGQIVTVAFQLQGTPYTLPEVTMPIATSIYDWLPIQVGDQGYTQAADAYLGGISGLGGGIADLTQPGNLAALVFVPVANSGWSAPGGDSNMRVTQGPDGVLVQDQTGAVLGKFSKTAGILLEFGTTSLQMTATEVVITVGGQTFTFTPTTATSTVAMSAPDITVANGSVNNHFHGGVQTGTGNTGTMTG